MGTPRGIFASSKVSTKPGEVQFNDLLLELQREQARRAEAKVNLGD